MQQRMALTPALSRRTGEGEAVPVWGKSTVS
jgi:hypothetical protein